MPVDKASLRVLLIEDNPADADLAREMLALAPGHAFNIEHVTGLKAGIGALTGGEKEAFDAVLLDLNLPDSQGLDTLRQLQVVSGSTPIVVLSGLADEQMRVNALRAGAQDFIGKNEPAARLLARSVLYSLERHRAHEQHRQVERLVSSNPDAVIVTDRNNVVHFVNAAAERLFGVAREDLLGEQIVFSVDPEAPTEIELLQGGGARTAEVRVVEFAWDGKPAFLAAIRDNTELKRLQTQLMMSDRMVSVGTLAAGVAHEINNPLAAVLANLDLSLGGLAQNADLQSSPVLGELVDSLRDARDAAERVRLIVRDLRVFSRAEEDKRCAVDVRQVLESTLRMAWNEIRHRARLVKDYGDVSAVEANESRLSQVFLNLIVNAAQAIPEGRAEANEIRITTTMDSMGRVIAEIRDTGPGIPPETLKRLFTPFFTTKPAGVGTGLGLVICQRIVTELGGDITVESRMGSGTTFKIVLPAAANVAPAEKIVAPVATAAVRRGQVLLVDDDPMIGRVVTRALSNQHDVLVFERAQEALDHIAADAQFDVILCDLMMPTMTGMEFYLHLQRAAPDLAQRVVFLTGGAFTVKAREFLDTVQNTRLGKPFDARNLQNLVNERVR